MLRLGIAGIGAIAGDYIGLIVGGKVRDVALTALCSRNEAHIREVAQRHGLQAAAFTDYGAMLRSGQVDAILICTPHAQHPEMTRQALEAGLVFSPTRWRKSFPCWRNGRNWSAASCIIGGRLRPTVI